MNASRFGLLAALSFAALGAYVGCGGGGGGGAGDDEQAGGDTPGGSTGQTGDLEIAFNPMYSGFDGVHEYRIPVKALGVKNVTFTASNPALVSIEKTSEGAMITTKGPGEVTITGSAGGLRGTAKLTITKYTPEQWEAGKGRYTNGEAFKLPEIDPCKPITTPPMISKRLACTNCHGVTGTLGDVEHTPEQTGGYSDADLVNIFTKATKPAGVGMRILPERVWKFFHTWEVTETEKTGIIAYLRSFEPKPANDSTDFGGRGRGDGGFQIPRCTDGGVTTRRDAGVGLDGG